ncbi:MAG TPA: hypothetical protein VMU05_03230, partial [Dongiaceae bacterium]|nr:hypothetical protein [Dongiaceae bacterium]
TNSAMYAINDQSFINNWSGLTNCAVTGVQQSEYPQWAAMSIVDGSHTGATPVFYFPNTIKHGWVCAGPASNYKSGSCTAASNCPNNSAAEGKYWYDALSNAADPQFLVTGTNSCNGPEGVTQGTDPDKGISEGTVIAGHMTTNCTVTN